MKHKARKRQKANAGRWAPESLNTRLWFEQDGKCCYCLKPMRSPSRGVNHRHAPTREHLRRISEGGENWQGNIRLAHRKCNSGRHDVNWIEWASIMRGELHHFPQPNKYHLQAAY